MANLTIAVDDEILKAARVKAVLEGTSVNAFLAEQLARYARRETILERQARASRRLDEIASEIEARVASGAVDAPRRWRRQVIYDERLDELDRRRKRR